MTLPGLCFTDDPGLHFSHDPLVVLLSFAIAAIASFASLDLGERWRNGGRDAWRWLIATAATFGGGIWATHFTGMLGASFSLPIRFNALPVVASLAIAVGSACFGFWMLPAGRASAARVIGSGTIVGTGVVVMHYAGMTGVVFPGHLAYRYDLWLLSAGVGVVACIAAMALAARRITTRQRVLVALAMAAAICGMHYIGMAAAIIPFDTPVTDAPGLESRTLAANVAAIAGLLVVLALSSAGADRRVSAAADRELRALQRENATLARSQQEIIHRLYVAGGCRDSDTGEHAARIGKLSQRLAMLTGCDAVFARDILAAASLHDIGKIAIPDAILLKTAALTRDERLQMQRHAEIGRRILSGSGLPLLDLAAEIAFTHHERWDGSGYPSGLRGKQIPLSGRIVAIADVFDALLATRPYKREWSSAEVADFLRAQAGKQFDADLTGIFLNDFPAMLALRGKEAGIPVHADSETAI